MAERPVIVWFRRDLRVADNPALLHAARSGSPVLPVYAADWESGDRWKPGAAGRWWLHESLARLSASLVGLGAPLTTVSGPPDQAIPRLARQVGAAEVLWNRLYEPYSRESDRRTAAALERDGVAWRSFNAGLLFEPEGHVSRAGKSFSQFTPYWRSCLALPQPEPPLPAPEKLRGMAIPSAPAIGGAGLGWAPEAGGDLWSPGEEGARQRLEQFLGCCLAGYDSARDIPAIEGTSRLSPHLHFGEAGPRQVWYAVRRIEEEAWRGAARSFPGPAVDRRAPAVDGGPFLRQLGWREFAHYILFHFPWIPEQPFRPEFARFPWEDDPVGLDAWKSGATGYRLVDAGMRQLAAEGWMHNRARMIAASFLTKDLLITWREGAAWFWDRLVDADLANNTLGWQWTAGSGPDAAPYFRIFNPTLQAQRFDSDAAYVGRWVGAAPGPAVDRPIVDHGEARARALAAFRGMRDHPSGG